jgi:chorismate mutase
MSAQKEDLSQFRKQIDKIDDKIISLLKDRMEIVKQVGKHKSQNSPTQNFIRAGREADMLRDLTKKADSSFPPAAIATIWRMIISTSLCTEQEMSISAYCDTNHNSCYWHAREYYGTFVKTVCEDSTQKVIENVASGQTSIGMLPLIDDSETPWWDRPREEKNNIYIFARIPFIESDDDDSIPSLSIANVMPENTDEDVSILSIHDADNKQQIIDAFKEKGLNAKIIASNNSSHLIEIDSFIDINSSIIKELQADISCAYIRLMGAYAVPIKL